MQHSRRGTTRAAEENKEMDGFYEDPTLADDEKRLAKQLVDKQRLEDALRPVSMDIGSNNTVRL